MIPMKRIRYKVSQRVLVQVKCHSSTAYQVAFDISKKEIHSALYSTSGEYDLFLIIYVPEDQDIGELANGNLLDIDGVERTMTTLTCNAF